MISFSAKTWRIIIPCAGGIIVLVVVLFAMDRCGTFNFNRGMSKANANLVKELDKLSNVQDQQVEKEKELHQLEIDEAVQKQIVIEAAKDAEAAAKAEREAQLTANQAATNVNTINAADFNGTTLQNAQSARCKAFPDILECK